MYTVHGVEVQKAPPGARARYRIIVRPIVSTARTSNRSLDTVYLAGMSQLVTTLVDARIACSHCTLPSVSCSDSRMTIDGLGGRGHLNPVYGGFGGMYTILTSQPHVNSETRVWEEASLKVTSTYSSHVTLLSTLATHKDPKFQGCTCSVST